MNTSEIVYKAMEGQDLLSPNQIMKRCHSPKPSRVKITAALNSMESRGLAYRVRKERADGESRRVWLWVRTDQGAKLGYKRATGEKEPRARDSLTAPSRSNLQQLIEALDLLRETAEGLVEEYNELLKTQTMVDRWRSEALAEKEGHHG